MIYGIGQLLVNPDVNSWLATKQAFGECLAAIEFNIDSNPAKATCWIDGKKQNRLSKLASHSATVKLTYEFIDWSTIQLAFGESSKAGSGFVPTVKTIQLTGNQFSELDINLNNVTSLRLYNLTKQAFMTLTIGVPSSNEYTVDLSGNIVVNQSEAGDLISYRYNKYYSSIDSIGTTDGSTDLDNISLLAVLASSVYPDGLLLKIDKLVRVNSPQLNFSNDKATIELTYQVLTNANNNKGYQIYKLTGPLFSNILLTDGTELLTTNLEPILF